MPTTPASEWKQANRKLVTLPSGRTVEIRKLTVKFLLAYRDTLELATVTGEQAIQAAKDLDSPDRRQRDVDLVVKEAVVRPKVVLPEVEPKEDELHPADFGPELGPLLEAITEFNPEIAARPFRPDAAGDDGARGGGDLRSAAEPDPAGVAGGLPDGPRGPGAGGEAAGAGPQNPPTPVADTVAVVITGE